MSLRVKVALALVVVVVPLALALALLGVRARREAVLETTYAATVARMEAGGRERCEAHDDDFRPRRRDRPHGATSRILAAFDAAYAGDGDEPLPPSVIAALESGDVAVALPTPHRDRIALRMPWSDGPCAIVVVEARRGTALGQRAAMRDLVVSLGVLLAAVVAAMVALGPTLRRLGLLSDAVRAAGSSALRVPDPVRGNDEVGALAKALEDADRRSREHVDRLEARDRALRDYVDGTTHDVALPITVLQGHLAAMTETTRRGELPAADDVSGAVAATQYLAQLSGNLAAAARLDGEAPLERRSIDLGALATRVTERLLPIARHRRVELACSVPDAPLLFDGDELLLERALANLVHNAIRHRSPDGEGHVAVLVEPGPRVRVLGDGAPATDDMLALLRRGEIPADPGRTRGRGLGLRIVRQVAGAHELALRFERAEGGGLEVVLEPRGRT